MNGQGLTQRTYDSRDGGGRRGGVPLLDLLLGGSALALLALSGGTPLGSVVGFAACILAGLNTSFSLRRAYGRGEPRLPEPLAPVLHALLGTAVIAWAAALLSDGLAGPVHLAIRATITLWGWLLALGLLGGRRSRGRTAPGRACLSRPEPTGNGQVAPEGKCGDPGHERGGEPAVRLPRLPAGSTKWSWSTATPPTTPSRSRASCGPTSGSSPSGAAARATPCAAGFAAVHRRHHRDARRRRVGRSGRDPALRRRARRRAPTSPRGRASSTAAAAPT